MLTVSNRTSEEFLADNSGNTATETLTIYGNKPNAIVRPLKHDEPGDGLLLEDIESQIIGTEDEKQDLFTKQLDNNLRTIHTWSKDSSKNGSTRDELHKKPLFITTVPRGVFLQPTKTLPPLSKKLYTFSSAPRALVNPKINYRYSREAKSIDSVDSKSSEKHEESNINKRYFKKKAEEVNLLVRGVRGFRLPVKSRDATAQGAQPGYQNVMHDRRIIRGTNYSHLNSGEGDSGQKEAEKQRRLYLRKKQFARNQRNIIGTPPPCKGRKHENVQTDKYLEELFDRPPELDACCQTDLFLQRPPTPKYAPSKTGVDAETQILDGELFDFDTEVMPILEVLVGRTIEQAIVEVMHEEELADLKEQQQKLLAIREKEEAEVKRLEEQERQLQSEKKKRIAQDKITKELDQEIQERITAAKLLQGHIAELLPGVLEEIEPFKEEKDREKLEEILKPWLAREVAEEIGNMIDSRELLEEIVKQVLLHRAELYTKLKKAHDEAELEGTKFEETKENELVQEKQKEELETE